MRFLAVPGYPPLKAYLTTAARHRAIPPAQLFVGGEGGMALPLALSFIGYVHCTQREEADACGHCKACCQMDSYTHPDLYYLFPTGSTKAKRNPQDLLASWRGFLRQMPHGNLQDWAERLGNEPKQLQISRPQVDELQELVAQKPFESCYKTVLVWLPEHLHPVAANAMLKMVEEPAPTTLFLFVSSASHQILPTLHSRMRTLVLPPLAPDQLHTLLVARGSNHTPERVSQVSKAAQGSLRYAEKLLEGASENHFASFISWLRALYKRDWGKVVKLAEEWQDQPVQEAHEWVLCGLHLLARTARLQAGFVEEALGAEASEEQSFCSNLGKVLSLERLSLLVEELTRLRHVLGRNGQPKLTLLAASLRLGSLFD